MSSTTPYYWGACTGMVLHLNDEETMKFFETYLKQTYKPEATEEQIEMFANTVSEWGEEMIFISSKNRKNTMLALPELKDIFEEDFPMISKELQEKINKMPENTVFSICEYSEDTFSGGLLYKTTKHYDEFCKRNVYCVNDVNDGILIYTNKSTLPQSILTGESYQSLDEIFEEYKAKLADYLPADFDWADHIGFFQCASYA